jgi:hypothetical protein
VLDGAVRARRGRMTPAEISGNLAAMGFLSQLRQDLQESLADQQRLALVQVLHKRFSTLTFDDLRQILTSPLGKGLGPMRLAEVLVGSPEAAAVEKPKTPSKAPARKKKPSPARKAAKKRQKPGRPRRARPAKTTADQTTAAPPTPGRKPRRKAKSAAKTRSGARQPAAHGPDWRPPGMSPEQASEMARYGEAILALIRDAGDWIAASEIRGQVGKSPEQLRLALRKLEASGDIVRTGQRGHTRYRAATS